MNTKQVTTQCPNGYLRLIDYLSELGVSEKAMDKSPWRYKYAMYNCFLGYSMDIEEFDNVTENEAGKGILRKFKAYEQALAVDLPSMDFMKYLNSIAFSERIRLYPEIDRRMTTPKFSDALKRIVKQKFISSCLLPFKPRKQFKDCLKMDHQQMLDKSMEKFWEESIQFSWSVRKGEVACPF